MMVMEHRSAEYQGMQEANRSNFFLSIELIGRAAAAGTTCVKIPVDHALQYMPCKAPSEKCSPLECQPDLLQRCEKSGKNPSIFWLLLLMSLPGLAVCGVCK